MKPINGLRSWTETHFEIVSMIALERAKKHPQEKIKEIQEDGGSSLFYDVAEELTNIFEKEHEDCFWDGEFFDEVEFFMYKWFSGAIKVPSEGGI